MISVDYEIVRKEAADQLGIRASVLDDLRSQKTSRAETRWRQD
jgi:hypothetical protein